MRYAALFRFIFDAPITPDADIEAAMPFRRDATMPV